MTSRRYFIRTALAGAGALMAAPVAAAGVFKWEMLERAVADISAYEAGQTATDEDFWYQVQQAYTVSPHFINLENGYFSLMARPVLEALEEETRMLNQQNSYYMRTRQFEDRARLKAQLARMAGVSPEELVITRNTTESLDTLIHGLPLGPGDEAVMSSQDYGSMLEAFAQQAKRTGIVNKIVDLPLHPKSDQEIVSCFEKAITPRTKVMLVTHLINLTGQILPVRAIAEMAHAKGVEIISDSAHAFAHIRFQIPDLGCDYFGCSLHKWLGAPVGNGLLYVRQDKIEKVWPLLGDTTFPATDIRKLEHHGTLPCGSQLAIAAAIRFHELIGAERKEERLRYLKNYWAGRVADLPGIQINTPSDPARSCGLGNVGLKGFRPSVLAERLFKDFGIFTVAIESPAVQGVRITPHLYTRLSDLNRLVEALHHLATKG